MCRPDRGRIRVKKFAAALALGVMCAPLAHAADAVVPPSPDMPPHEETRPRWALQITPYMWATGMKGHISPFRRLPTISVHKTFSDVVDDLDFGGFANIWGRYERFVVSGDLMYVSTSDSHSFTALPHVPLPPNISVTAKVKSTQLMAALMGGYRVVDTPDFSLDALGGVRFWHISNDVTASALGMNVSYGESFSWVDPMVGARAFLHLGDKASLHAQADIGGFNAGSDLTWSVLATVNYAFTDHFSVSAGYKVIDVNYDRRGHVFDTRLSGPVLGFTYRF